MSVINGWESSAVRPRAVVRTVRIGVALFAAMGSRGCHGPVAEVAHPTPENLPPEGSPMLRASGLPRNLSPDRLDLWSAARTSFLRADSSQALFALGRHGEMGDTSLDIFGSRIYAAIDPEGTLFVLDRQNHSVKVFDDAGIAVASFGRAGQGPTEFHDPSDIVRLPEGRIAVVDRGRRVSFFSPSDAGYVHTTTRAVNRRPERACVSHGRMWIANWDRDSLTTIAEIEFSDGSRSRSFGRGYRSRYWLVRDQMSTGGHIACLGDPARLLFAFEGIPVVEAYDANAGEMLWSAGVEDWEQAVITEIHEGDEQPMMEMTGWTGEYVWGMKTLPNDFVLYQVIGYDEAGESYEVRSFLIDAPSGEGALVSADLPLVLAFGPDRIVFGWRLPFPRLEVRPLNWNAPAQRAS